MFGGASLDYQGGPVMQSNRTHVIFWNPSNSLSWDPGYKEAIIGYLQNVAADNHKATNVYALTPQYTDATGRAFYDSSYAGAIDDSSPAPANGCMLPSPPPLSTGPTLPGGTGWPICLTATQLRDQVARSSASRPADRPDRHLFPGDSGRIRQLRTAPV